MLKIFEKYYCHNVLIVGDFNIPSINWPLLDSINAHGKLLIDFLQNFQLSQHVTTYTRLNAILDLVIAAPHLISNCIVGDGISDHDIVIFDINKTRKITKKKKLTTGIIPHLCWNYSIINL